MADFQAYFNGEWRPYSQVRIDPMDRGFSIGDVVYDVERTFNGKVFRLKEHIDRLYRSLKYVRIDPGLSPEEMTRLSEEVVERNADNLPESGDFMVTQFVSRGMGYYAWNSGPPTVCVKANPLNFGGYAQAYETGQNAAIARTRTYPPDVLDAKVKHWSRLPFALAELESNDVDAGAWPIILDIEGNVAEGSRYNVMVVTNGTIRSAGDRSILQGISRGMVFDLARQLRIPAVEEDLQPYDVYTADEVFFAATTYCVLPVIRVDKRTIGDGKPGPVTQQLLAAWSESVGIDIVGQAMKFGKK